MDKKIMLDKIMEHAKYIKDNDLPHEGLDIIQTKWYGRILLELCKHETMRFGELKRALPGISNVVLSAALKGLAEKGLLVREQFNEIPPHVEYTLTPKGQGMLPVFYEIIQWEERDW